MKNLQCIGYLFVACVASAGCAGEDVGTADFALPISESAGLNSGTQTDIRTSYQVNGPDFSKWFIVENGSFATRTEEQSTIVAPLVLPHGCALDAVEVVMSGGNGHVEMPQWLPTLEVVRRDLVGYDVDYLGVSTDNSITLESYQRTHTITVDIEDEIVDATRMVYYAVFKTEYGKNARNYSSFNGIRHRCTRWLRRPAERPSMFR